MTIQPRAAFEPAAPTPNKPLAGKKICIDPGHGGKDPGASGPTGLKEKDVNLDISLRLQKDLVELGATVVMTRSKDTQVGKPGSTSSQELQARCDVANKAKADVFVCVHNNALTDPKKSGMEVYIVRQAGTRTKRLAGTVYDHLKSSLQTKPNGILEAGFYVLKYTKMPAVLTEIAYMSNPQEEALLKTADFKEKAAQAIADGVVDYFKNPTGALDPAREDLKPRPATDLPLDLEEEEFLVAGSR